MVINSVTHRVCSRTLGWLLAGGSAVVITVFLVALMHVLIAAPVITPPVTPTYKPIDIALVETVIETIRAIPKPIKPTIEKEPEIIINSSFEQIEKNNLNEGGVFRFEPTKNTVDIGSAPSNLPVVRMMMQPQYPASAANKGIEGYVDVRFDITRTGSTENIEVIGAQPPAIFNTAAVNAIKRWKYTPPTENGETVPFYGMSKRLVFNLEKK